ncbi:hypothetical protein [Spirosoma validum]|uniref:Uncharacterized protein n=1 Tax=Spirosoma validum TaxID=2771355 RepID=A0A927B111_9BACT|nr:hypothetical protein [Spirosoma validum]MBD2753435.1 hypothetical protein [Spirosoma validum]
MGLAAQFETIIERQLNVHAAWVPVTTPYKLGDYGLISDGVFQKLGNIKDEFNVSFTEGTGEDATLSFVSDNTIVVDTSAGAEVTVSPESDIKANITYKFQNDKSFLVKAPIINVSVIENVNQVAQQLKKVDAWRRVYKVVFQVYVAQNPLILSTVTGDTDVTIGGSGSALPQFNIGNASASFSLKTTKELGLNISGKTGVIALGLFKLSLIGGNVSFLGAEENDNVEPENLNEKSLADDI